jgi:ribosomal protein S18 acetylase RimI-like enzyme
MHMSIGIALAIDEDIPDIELLLSHGIRSKMNHGDLAWGATATDEGELEAIIAAGNMYVAYSEEDIVAVFMLFWDDPARWGQQQPVAGYLHRFVVAPGLRGQHVGEQIIGLMCEEIAKHGRQYLRLTCPSSNKKLQEYHLKNGFTRADHNASPAHLSEPVAFFERPVTGELAKVAQTSAKKSFAQKLRSVRFGQRYE